MSELEYRGSEDTGTYQSSQWSWEAADEKTDQPERRRKPTLRPSGALQGTVVDEVATWEIETATQAFAELTTESLVGLIEEQIRTWEDFGWIAGSELRLSAQLRGLPERVEPEWIGVDELERIRGLRQVHPQRMDEPIEFEE